MSLVEEYYELNEAEKVSLVWKCLQIILCGCAAISGLASGFALAVVRMKFAERCYLFTEVKISHLGDNAKEHKIVNWESDAWCDYYQFIMVSSFIVATIWATLFLMCGKGGKSPTGLPQPWRIVWPSVVFNFIYFTIVLSTAIRIQQGTDYFCGPRTFKIIKPKSLLDNCQPLKLLIKKDLYMTSVLIEVILKSSWGCALSWLLLLLLSLYRITFFVDFQLYKISVFKIDESLQNRKEEVLKITSYEEPKQTYPEDTEEKYTPPPIRETRRNFEEGIPHNVKLKTKPNYFTSSGLPTKQISTFYVTADVRMLKLEKKRKKCLKALDEAFGNNSFRDELKQSVNNSSNSDNSETTEGRALLFKNSQDLNYNEGNENEMNSTSALNKTYLSDDDENPEDDFDSSHSLSLKKQI